MGTYEEYMRLKNAKNATGATGGNSNVTAKQSPEEIYNKYMAVKQESSVGELWEKSGIEAMDRDFTNFGKIMGQSLQTGRFWDVYDGSTWRQHIANERKWLESYGRSLGTEGAGMISDALNYYEEALDYFDNLYRARQEYEQGKDNYETASESPGGVNLRGLYGASPVVSDSSALILGTTQYDSNYLGLASSFDPYLDGTTVMDTETQGAMRDNVQKNRDEANLALSWLGSKKASLDPKQYETLVDYYRTRISGLDYMDSVIDWYAEGGSAETLAKMDEMIEAFQNGTAPTVFVGNSISTAKARVEEIDLRLTELDALIGSAEEILEEEATAQESAALMGEAYKSNGIAENNLTAYQAERGALLDEKNKLIGQIQVLEEEEQYYWGLAIGAKNVDENAESVIQKGSEIYNAQMSMYNDTLDHDERYTGKKVVTMTFQTEEEYRNWNGLQFTYYEGKGVKEIKNPDGSITVQYTEENPGWTDIESAINEARDQYPLAVTTDHMNAEQKDVFYYLVGQGYTDMALDYAEQLMLEERQEFLNEVSEWAGTNFGTGLLATMLYGVLYPVTAIEGVGVVNKASDYLFLTENEPERNLSTGLYASGDVGSAGLRNALSGGVSNKLNSWVHTPESWGSFFGNRGFGDLYQMGLSMADSYAGAMAFGKLNSLVMGLSSAASIYSDVITRGGSEEQAIAMGVAYGIEEALFEFVSIGQFLDGKVTGKMIVDALIQAGVEMSEETLTSLANELTDRIIMRDKSEYYTNVEKYMKEEGLSREEAEEKATREFWGNVAWDGVAGFITGGFMGGAQAHNIYSSVDKVMGYANSNNPADLLYYEMAKRAAEISENDSDAETRRKLAAWIKDGANVSGEIAKDVMTEYEGLTEQVTAAKEKAEPEYRGQRYEMAAEEIVENARVIAIEGFTGLGMSQREAEQNANNLARAIRTGEITDKGINQMKPTNIRYLAVIEDALNVEIPRAKGIVQARANVRAAIEEARARYLGEATAPAIEIGQEQAEQLRAMSDEELQLQLELERELRDDTSAQPIVRQQAQQAMDVLEQEYRRRNGGAKNVQQQEQEAPAPAAKQGKQAERGTPVRNAESKRNDRVGTGEQDGAVQERNATQVEQGRQGTNDQGDRGKGVRKKRDLSRYENIAKTKSTRDYLGKAGAEEVTLGEVTEEYWTDEMRQAAEKAEAAGLTVHYVVGSILRSNGDRGGGGVYYRGTILASVNDVRFLPEQLVEHEIYHADATQEATEEILAAIRERYTKEEFERIVREYADEYNGIIAEGDTQALYEEIAADAAGGMNRFANTGKVAESREQTQEIISRKGREAQGGDWARAPPAEPKYSYAGEEAKTADLKSLKAAQEMLELNAAMEDIRKATGWHQGKDGKWRFEIDDSGMKYFRGGDAQFQRDHPEYAEYQTLLQKMLFGTITSEEYSRMQEIDSTWGNEYGRLRERLRNGSGKLINVIQHDALFAAYPELENVGFQFQELPAGVNGYFDKAQNRIVLSEKLANAPEAAILHEIQHVIQIYEGFAPGASMEYWEAKAQEQGLTAEELYRNTAGEIEARDTAARRKLTAEERKKTSPDYGDENTVLVKENAKQGQSYSLSPTKRANLEKSLDKLGEKRIVLFAGEKKIILQTDDFTKDKNIYSKKGRTNKEVNARIKAIPKFEKIIKESRFDWTDTQISGIDSKAKKNVIAIHHFVGEHDGFIIDVVIRDKGKAQYLYEIKFIENKKSPKQSMADKTASTAPNGDVWDNKNISQKEPAVKQDFAVDSEAADAAYMEAVEAGDMETAQRMVDEAAKRAGYTQRAYHGTDADRFNVFDPVKIGEATGVGILGDGFYFADSKKAANKYGKTVYDVYLKAENTYHASESDLYKIKAVELEKQGYDSVDLQTGIGKIIMVFDPQQIKSADPVTYDDDGNVIPLSERFDPEQEDIRWSAGTVEERDAAEGFPWSYKKPLRSTDTRLSPRDAARYLAAATGKEWNIQRIKGSGEWKAVPGKRDAGGIEDKAYEEAKAEAEARGEKPMTLKQFAWVKLQEARLQPGERISSVHPEGIERDEFEGTEAINKLGIRISGSVVDYADTETIKEREMALRKSYLNIQKMERALTKNEGKAGLGSDTIRYARGIAEGELLMEDIPKRLNRRDVIKLAEMLLDHKMIGEDLSNKRKLAINRELQAEALARLPDQEGVDAGTEQLKKLKLAIMNYRTPERNLRAMFGDQRGAELFDYYFRTVRENEAERKRWMQEQFDGAREFAGKDGKSESLNKQESAYVHAMLDMEGYSQLIERSRNAAQIKELSRVWEEAKKKDPKADLGARAAAMEQLRNGAEAQTAQLNDQEKAMAETLTYTEVEWAQKWAEWRAMQDDRKTMAKIDKIRCDNAVMHFRAAFDAYYKAMVDFMVAHGLTPLGHIDYYAPHLTINDRSEIMAGFFDVLGLKSEKFGNISELPADIAGKTQDFRPTRKWNPFALKRTGTKTDYNIVEAFEKYVTHVAEVFYHHDDLLKLRALETATRNTANRNWQKEMRKLIMAARSGDLQEKQRVLRKLGVKMPENMDPVEMFRQLSREADVEQKHNWLIKLGEVTKEEVLTEEQVHALFDELGSRSEKAFIAKADQLFKEYGLATESNSATLAEAEDKLNRIFEHLLQSDNAATQYTNFVQWLNNYNNLLAGKQYGGDRGMEYSGGRKLLDLVNNISRRFSGAKVIGNMGSVIAQTAQMPAIIKSRSAAAQAKAFRDIMASVSSKFERGKELREWKIHSDILTGKRGVEYIDERFWEKVIGYATKPMEWVDSFVTTFAARSAYYDAIDGKVDGIAKGNQKAANRYADDFATQIMGVRDKGSRPNAFSSKLGAMVNVFQVEALNLADHFASDMPAQWRADARKYGKAKASAKLAWSMFVYFAAAFLLNRGEDELYGQTPAAFSIADYILQFIAAGYGVTTNELIFGGGDKKEEFQWDDAWAELGNEVVGDVPLVSNFAALAGIGDQKMPLPDVSKIWDGVKKAFLAMTDQGVSGREAMKAIGKALAEVMPLGNQINKTIQGIIALADSGVYNDDGALQWAVDNDAWSILRNVIFGVNATQEAQAYYAGGYGALNAQLTEAYEEFIEDGMEPNDAYDLVYELRKIDSRNADLTAAEVNALQREWINQADISDEDKLYLFTQTFGSKDPDTGMIEHKDAEAFALLMDAGMSWAEIQVMYEKHEELENVEETESHQKNLDFSYWVRQQNYNAEQEELILKNFGQVERFVKLADSGIGDDAAKELEEQFQAYADGLPEGESLQSVDKIRIIIDYGLSDSDCYKALRTVLGDGTFDKLSYTRDNGISCQDYMSFYLATKDLESDRDEDGKIIKGQATKDKVLAYIDSLPISREEKDILFLTEYKESGLPEAPWN